MIDLRSSDTEGIRKLMDECHSNIQVLAQTHPEVIDQLYGQVKSDEKMYARLPTFVCIPTNSGLVNTTIRTSQLLQFYQLFKQRPDLIGTKMAENIVSPMKVGLVTNSESAKEKLGEIPEQLLRKK